ncbi:hypothetical protein J2S49_000487 [Arcanobacterium wilhelmae]|uniref:DUF2505 domain-containing protein n=1 Tax=Arcanobacterium wilhelmae TaxID=1803177 RepID=A0ABT9N9N5_9ACTO|nr:DUF2505 domain-containing protein [Arcanobacterium wilhelmae]MDP9800411.1 hypothetical protein [Arcanobacterium wilhelmae]WFN89837.1 DUF2505 domain-containing protein [Arcanobacterium wilhelmae]
MEFSARVKYAGTPQEVAGLLVSRELAQARAAKAGMGEFEYAVEDGATVVRVRVGGEALPDFARKFAKGGLSGQIQARSEGNVVRHLVKVAGMPVSARFDVVLSPDAGGTVGEVRGEVTVSVPFVGKKIEEKAVVHAQRAVEEDAAIVNSLLG